jgi:hypothetical protein
MSVASLVGQNGNASMIIIFGRSASMILKKCFLLNGGPVHQGITPKRCGIMYSRLPLP